MRSGENRLLVIDRQLNEVPADFGGLRGEIARIADNTLVMLHEDGCSVLDARAGGAIRKLSLIDVPPPDFTPDVAFLRALVDTCSGTYLKLNLSYDRFELDDRGYSGPTQVALLPDKRLAIAIARNSRFAVYDWRSDELSYVPLAGPRGNGDPQVRDGTLWMTAYDMFCRIDPVTMETRCSDVLQPAGVSRGRPVRQFIGVPEYVTGSGMWLIPRPYNGDVILVDGATLQPKSLLKTDGRPNRACVMDDGFLFISDHPTSEVRAFHMDQFAPFL
ncbi:hypothetical protein [Ponticaulis profundi]